MTVETLEEFRRFSGVAALACRAGTTASTALRAAWRHPLLLFVRTRLHSRAVTRDGTAPPRSWVRLPGQRLAGSCNASFPLQSSTCGARPACGRLATGGALPFAVVPASLFSDFR